MFLLNILEAVLAYDLVKIRFMKEKEVILNGNTNDKSRGIQLIGPGYLQKVIKGVNWLLSPIANSKDPNKRTRNERFNFGLHCLLRHDCTDIFRINSVTIFFCRRSHTLWRLRQTTKRLTMVISQTYWTESPRLLAIPIHSPIFQVTSMVPRSTTAGLGLLESLFIM